MEIRGRVPDVSDDDGHSARFVSASAIAVVSNVSPLYLAAETPLQQRDAYASDAMDDSTRRRGRACARL